MIKFLLEIIDSYENSQKHDVNFNRLQWIIVVLFVLWDLGFLSESFLEPKHYQILFKELCVTPHSIARLTHFNEVQETILISEMLRKKLFSLLKYIQNKMTYLKSPITEIMFSFPMLHFAQGVCVPLADISILPIANAKSALQHFKTTTERW